MYEVKRQREKRGLSQAKLAARSGLNPVTINRIEHGETSPTVVTLQKLADALECELSDFFPKAQSPLPYEGPSDASVIYEDAIALAAGGWLEGIQSGEADTRHIIGWGRAAFDLASALWKDYESDTEEASQEAYNRFTKLPEQDQQGIVQAHTLLLDVVKEGHEALKERGVVNSD